MPFGGACEYEDFAACVRANRDKENPRAYCAALMAATEEHCRRRAASVPGQAHAGRGIPAGMSELLTRAEFEHRIRSGVALPADGAKLIKAYDVVGAAKLLDEDKRQVRFTLSTAAVDRDRDTIAVAGWRLDQYRKNPIVLFAHNPWSLPIAKAVEITATADRLSAVDEFPEKGVFPFADTTFDLIKGGFLNATSVGFRPEKWTVNEDRRGLDFLEQELLEHSVVPLPSNPEALVEARDAGIDLVPLKYWAEQTLALVTDPRLAEQLERAAKTAAGRVQVVVPGQPVPTSGTPAPAAAALDLAPLDARLAAFKADLLAEIAKLTPAPQAPPAAPATDPSPTPARAADPPPAAEDDPADAELAAFLARAFPTSGASGPQVEGADDGADPLEAAAAADAPAFPTEAQIAELVARVSTTAIEQALQGLTGRLP